ncbi:hypothetical protein [Rhizobium sp. MHM7A]|uniref:hypothetical protein n=1 Tax=Rhizobium sp. MHM7A TaxID=2583233 RepID=UPI001105B788|nr:hypothetical protein [Rhizobium sp. MHM7A]TLX16938.1 hypothetical protein FFR93_06220 [Rhizobium sp. MHM7A]
MSLVIAQFKDSMLKTILLASASLAVVTSVFAEPIYVLRPPTVPSSAKVLPLDAFSSDPQPPSEGTDTPSTSDPDVLVYEASEWDYHWENFENNYVTFRQPAPISATISLSKDDGYYYFIPSEADNCWDSGGPNGLNVLHRSRLGSLEDGKYVTHVNSEERFELITLDPKIVGTYHFLVKCEGPHMWDPEKNAPTEKPPFVYFGSFQRVTVRAVP